MITLEEARKMIGQKVLYRPSWMRDWVGGLETGVITSVNDTYVFVRYSGGYGSAATYPNDLEKVTPE